MTMQKLMDRADGTYMPLVAVDGGSQQSYTLLKAATATGPAVAGVRGGDYIWRIEGTFSSGVTATLQYLGLDGTTWKNVRNAANTADVSATGEAQVGLGVGQGATLRVLIAGTQTTPLNSTLAGLS